MVCPEIRDHKDLLDPLERGVFQDLLDSQEAKAALDPPDLVVLMDPEENKEDLVLVVLWANRDLEVPQDSLGPVEDKAFAVDQVLMAHWDLEVYPVNQVHKVNLENAEA